jgi:hypothetical protein
MPSFISVISKNPEAEASGYSNDSNYVHIQVAESVQSV